MRVSRFSRIVTFQFRPTRFLTNLFMYIIAIAWIYVVLLMAATEPSMTASIMTFLFYCVLPLTLFFYLIRTPQRKRMRLREEKLKSDIAVTNLQETALNAKVADAKND